HYNPTSRDIQFFQKKKEEKDKALFAVHHSMRISQALSLMNEILSETVVLQANAHRPLYRKRSPQECRKRHMASTKGGKYSGFVDFVLILFSSCRGHPGSPVLAERSGTAAKPRSGRKVHCFTPTLDSTQARGKN
ncbi:Uncharacterized protein C5orf42, partial [Mesitornis unicolor]